MQREYAAVGHLSMESKMRGGFGTSPAVRAALFEAYGLSKFGVFLRVALVLKMVRARQNSSSSQGGDVVSMGIYGGCIGIMEKKMETTTMWFSI